MTELHELLERAAGDEPVGFTTVDVERRVRRRTSRRRAGAGAAAAALVVLGLATWISVDRTDERRVATAPTSDRLEDVLVGEWVINDLGIVPGGAISPRWLPTLTFEPDGTVNGSLGCNTFGGMWAIEGSRLRLPERISTTAGCEDDRMAVERHLDELLNDGPNVTVLDEVGRSIELRSGERFATFRKPVVEVSDLVEGHWVATDGGDDWPFDVANGRTGRPSLHFSPDGAVEGTSVCNGFSGKWDVEEGRLVVREVGMTYARCQGEEEFWDFVRGSPQVWWWDISPDRLILRGEGRWLELTRTVSDGGNSEDTPAFEVLHTDRATDGHIGMLGAATDEAALSELWEALGLTGSVPVPSVDFERRVVVAIVIPDNACPPELVDVVVEGSTLMPVFQQPDGPCRLPLWPKVYVVSMSHELAPPGSMWRYPDDPELELLRHGPREIPIWPSAGNDLDLVEVHFSPESLGDDCSATRPVQRRVRGVDPLEGALWILVGGPSPHEQEAGLHSAFSFQTYGMLRSVVVEGGVAHVDFDDFSSLLPNASTSCGSAALLSSLGRTVTQFDGVERAIYYFEGSASAFYEWLQSAAPPDARPSSGW
jgi:heat shock protein HslJ